MQLKWMMQLIILYAECSKRQKSFGVPSAGIAIFTNCCYWCTKLQMSDMPDIGNFVCQL